MAKQRFFISYLFISLLIVVGLVLFIVREQAADILLPDSLLTRPSTGGTLSSGGSALSLDILRDDRVRTLKNRVEWFDYNDLNKSQELISNNTSPIINPENTGANSTSTPPRQITPTKVRVGNSNPFLAPIKQ